MKDALTDIADIVPIILYVLAFFICLALLMAILALPVILIVWAIGVFI